MLPFRRRAAARLLGLVCLWWVWLAHARTDAMAARFGTDAADIRALGARDAVSAAALLTARDPRPALWARAILDLIDMMRLGRGRRDLQAVTGGFAAVALLALLGRRGR